MQHSTELNDVVMTLDELIELCDQSPHWVKALIDENIIEYDVPNSEKFSGYQLTVVRRASRLSRDFDASIPAIGLILELLGEVEQLRQFKRQWEAQGETSTIIEVNWQ